MILNTIMKNFDKLKGKSFNIYVLRKLEVLFCQLIEGPSLCIFDDDTELIENINIEKCMEEIKLKFIN